MSDFVGSHPTKGLGPPWVFLGVRARQAWLLGIPRSQLGTYKSTEATLAAQRPSLNRESRVRRLVGARLASWDA